MPAAHRRRIHKEGSPQPRRAMRSLLTVLLAFLGPQFAIGAFISFDGEKSPAQGTGLGNVLTVAQLVDEDDQEWGAVRWDGTQDVFINERQGNNGSVKTSGQNSSQTRTAGELAAKGITASNMAVVLNLNETGSNPAINLNDFSLIFFSADASQSFQAKFSEGPPNADVNALSEAGQGTGSSGFVFPVTFDGTDPFSFFADPDNRVGLEILEQDAITNAQGGAETFYVIARQTDAAVPEPACGWLLLSLFWLRRKRSLGRAMHAT